MKFFLRSVVLILGLAGLLAACGDLPRPFEGAGRAGDPGLLELRDTGTVRVEATEDLPEGASAHLARAMARALRLPRDTQGRARPLRAISPPARARDRRVAHLRR